MKKEYILISQFESLNQEKSNFQNPLITPTEEKGKFLIVIGYLNINHLGSKIHSLRDICSKLPSDVLCIDETKLDSSYPDPQLKILGY